MTWKLLVLLRSLYCYEYSVTFTYSRFVLSHIQSSNNSNKVLEKAEEDCAFSNIHPNNWLVLQCLMNIFVCSMSTVHIDCWGSEILNVQPVNFSMVHITSSKTVCVHKSDTLKFLKCCICINKLGPLCDKSQCYVSHTWTLKFEGEVLTFSSLPWYSTHTCHLTAGGTSVFNCLFWQEKQFR